MKEEAIKIIEDYLEKVRENLPPNLDGEIIEELRSHLLDMVNERGGLTVENARWAIEKMGDPVKLAEEIAKEEGYFERKKKRFEIVVRWGEKNYRWGFELSEDLLDNLFRITIYLIVFVAIFSILASAFILFIFGNYSASTTLISRGIGFVIQAVIFIFIAMWLLSILGFDFEKKSKKPIVVKVVRKRHVVIKPRPSYAKITKYTVSSFFKISIGFIIIWIAFEIIGFKLTYVTKAIWLSISLALIYGGFISIGKAIHHAMEGRDSPTLEFISATSSLVLIPALILTNLYPEQLQIPIITLEKTNFGRENILEYIKSIELMFVPSKYITLVQTISIILIVLIVINIVLKATIYSKNKPFFR